MYSGTSCHKLSLCSSCAAVMFTCSNWIENANSDSVTTANNHYRKRETNIPKFILLVVYEYSYPIYKTNR